MFAQGFVVGFVCAALVFWLRSRSRSSPPAPTVAPPAVPTPQLTPEPAGPGRREAELEAALQQAYESSSHPEMILEHPAFEAACVALRGPEFSLDELRGWIVNDRRFLHLAAVDAILRQGGPPARSWVLAGLGNFTPWGRYLTLRLLDRGHEPPECLVHETLANLDRTWTGDNELRVLREWVGLRRQGGESPPEGEEWSAWCEARSDQELAILRQLLWELGPSLARPWMAALREWDSSREEEDAGPTQGTASIMPGQPQDPLKTCGRLWTADAAEPDRTIPFAALEEVAERIGRLLREVSPRPVVLVGAPRTGKTQLVRHVMSTLLDDGWRVLEATPDQVNAGMSFIGELENRVRLLIHALTPDEQTLWYVPDFTGLLWSGTVANDPTRSIARMLRHDLESRRVVMLGECTRATWEKARLTSPWLAAACEVIEVPVPDEATTCQMVATWLRHRPDEQPQLDPALLTEAWDLTAQFLDENQRPGNLFDTVRRVLEDRERDREAAGPITREDLLRSVSRRTGLSVDLLDDRRSLDLDRVEAFFRERIFGQDEAVTCLVERLAMIKAGLTDPTRPLGVFLFAGPTGSGKTELAKVLSTWLFGSPSRLVRVDMSELQDASALDRLLGSPTDHDAAPREALVDAIRREPFSVVLLDEFEKASPHVWDLFLQVFDDGRLSDRRGRVADFRHCVMLLTTNVGSTIETRPDVGFDPQSAGFRASRIEDALRGTFRPEFLNRLDQIVVFRPLSRDVMRAVLRRQIESVTRRRGLRYRPWAMEWDASALELLLDKGFSSELGARPLQRAIEKHLLAPLARTIAAQQAPEGDQFLFLRAEGSELVIDFVDPDAPADPVEVAAPVAGAGVSRIALEGRGTAAELAVLGARLQLLEQRVQEDAWERNREAELEMTSLPDFWESNERFEVLDVFQTRERIGRMLGTCRSLHDRLAKPGREHVPAEPLQQLAVRLHVVAVAIDDVHQRRPRESVIAVQPGRPDEPVSNFALGFARRLIDMYRGWARRRGATLQELTVDGVWVGHVQGFGAWTLLQPENGLHVWESHEPDRNREVRHTVRVHVMPVAAHAPDTPLVRQLSQKALREPLESTSRTVVRRYREQPSPLVRDAVRGWRTGRIERVLQGDFDLLEDDAAAAERV